MAHDPAHSNHPRNDAAGVSDGHPFSSNHADGAEHGHAGHGDARRGGSRDAGDGSHGQHTHGGKHAGHDMGAGPAVDSLEATSSPDY